MSLTGTLNDLAVEKAFGKEKLENGRFAVTYERGGFSLKGDGPGARLAAHPRPAPTEGGRTGRGQRDAPPRRGPAGETRPAGGTATRRADPAKDQPRHRKGQPGALAYPHGSGSVPSLIDGLIPGFVKPAGKPGRVSFVMTEVSPGGAMDLRDIVLDAGSASARGTAAINGDGQFDRADLSSFKLSPGDDMRIQIDRSGNLYKVGVKGAVADARPFMKSLGAPEGKATKESGRDSPRRSRPISA